MGPALRYFGSLLVTAVAGLGALLVGLWLDVVPDFVLALVCFVVMGAVFLRTAPDEWTDD